MSELYAKNKNEYKHTHIEENISIKLFRIQLNAFENFDKRTQFYMNSVCIARWTAIAETL